MGADASRISDFRAFLASCMGIDESEFPALPGQNKALNALCAQVIEPLDPFMDSPIFPAVMVLERAQRLALEALCQYTWRAAGAERAGDYFGEDDPDNAGTKRWVAFLNSLPDRVSPISLPQHSGERVYPGVSFRRTTTNTVTSGDGAEESGDFIIFNSVSYIRNHSTRFVSEYTQAFALDGLIGYMVLDDSEVVGTYENFTPTGGSSDEFQSTTGSDGYAVVARVFRYQ